MTTVTDLMERVEQLNVEKAAEESINDTASIYAQKNIDQMYAGKRSDGKDIEPEYAPSTKKQKRRKGQPTDRVTLKDKGDFYEGYEVKAVNGEILSGSNVEYEQYLDKRYTEKIHGLSDESMGEYKEEALQEAFVDRIGEQTNL